MVVCERPAERAAQWIAPQRGSRALNGLPFQLYSGVASCVKNAWNTLHRVQIISLNKPVKALWGKRSPIIFTALKIRNSGPITTTSLAQVGLQNRAPQCCVDVGACCHLIGGDG
jgi:hypothetical protein